MLKKRMVVAVDWSAFPRPRAAVTSRGAHARKKNYGDRNRTYPLASSRPPRGQVAGAGASRLA